MSCPICGRFNCMKSFHSFEQQNHYDHYSNMDNNELIRECMDKDNEIETLNQEINNLQNALDETEIFINDILPFLKRLLNRSDKYETNDYICNSSDYKRAMNAVKEYLKRN